MNIWITQELLGSYRGARTTTEMFGDVVNVIPLTVAQFVDVLKFFSDNYFQPG